MIVLAMLNFIFTALLGYLTGRWSDYYLNFWIGDPNWTPHHWIYGILLMIGGFLFKNYIGLWIFFFGSGNFISDFKDFLNFKFIGSDKKTKGGKKILAHRLK